MRSGLVSVVSLPGFSLAMGVCVGFPLSVQSGQEVTSLRKEG